MEVSGEWDLPLNSMVSVDVILCEDAMSLTLFDADSGKDVTVHLDPLAVGQLIGLLTAAGESWLQQIGQAAEAAEGGDA